MTRGQQREKDRERAAARAAKNKKGGDGKGGAQGQRDRNASDAQKLAEKKAMKEKMKAEGKIKQKKQGTKNPFAGQKKIATPAQAINPHTGQSPPPPFSRRLNKTNTTHRFYLYTRQTRHEAHDEANGQKEEGLNRPSSVYIFESNEQHVRCPCNIIIEKVMKKVLSLYFFKLKKT
jgi:hypothetical protein